MSEKSSEVYDCNSGDEYSLKNEIALRSNFSRVILVLYYLQTCFSSIFQTLLILLC